MFLPGFPFPDRFESFASREFDFSRFLTYITQFVNLS